MVAPVIQDEISIGEQSEVSIPDYIIQSSNLKANLNSSAYPKSLQIIIECLKSSVLMRALTLQKEIPKSLVNLAFSKATFVKEQDIVSFAVHGGRTLTISKKNFIRLMGLQDTENFITPTAEELIGMFNQMGCTPMLTKISQFKKNKLPFLWNFLFTIFKRCLCGRKSGLDSVSQLFLSMIYGIYYNVQIDYGSILWYEFTESVKVSMAKAELTSHRFWSVIVESAYSIAKIPIDTTEEPKITFNEFQVPKKIPSQPEFEFVGQIPVSMIGRIPLHSEVLMGFKSETSHNFPLRVIPEAILNEIQTQNMKVSLKRKEVAESSEVEVTKPKKKKTKLSTLVLVDESDENEADIEGMEERENPVKKSNRLMKGKKVRKESQTPTHVILEKSKKRRLRLAADLDDDVHPISQVFSIAPSLNVIDPIDEEQEVGNLNEENMERDVHNFEEETAQDDTAQDDTAQVDTMIVRTAVVNEVVNEVENEEEMGGEESRIENEMVCDEVAQGEIITTGAEEIALVVSEVESEVVTTEVANEVVVTEGVNKTVVTEVVTTEVSAQVVNKELDATEEYRTENLQVVNESEEDTNADVDQSCSEPPPIPNTISEPIMHTVSEPIPNPTSESGIFSDLRNLNVTLPVISPVIQSTTQQQEKEIMFENISFTGEDLCFDDEDLEMAPIDLMKDDNENEDENDLMSIKQFRILNRKLNMILRISERPADLSTSRESELDKVSLEWNEKFNLLNSKMSTLTERFDGFKDTMQKDNTYLKNEVVGLKNEVKNLDDEVRKLNSEIAQLSAKNVEELKLRIDEMNKEKSTIQKALDDALAHIQFLEPSIKIYDQKELADDYNVKVVQHVELVQRDFMSKLAPLQKLLSILPKIPVLKTAVPVNISSSKPSPTVRMDYPLFSVTSQTITQPTSTPILIPQRILQKGVVIGSSAPMQTTSTVVTTYAGSSSKKGKEIMEELSKEERIMCELDASEKLRQQLSLMRQGELFKNPGETKIWSENTIRDLAFGEDNFFSYLPKLSYNTELQPGMQLDLPQVHKLFTVKCFKIPSAVKFSTNDYNEKLICFYGSIGLEESQVWSLSAIRKIIKVEKGDLFENTFQNFVFTVERGDSKTYTFTLADLPVLNPMDLIQILKLLHLLEKIDVTILINHLRSLLHTYVSEIATKDMIVAKALGKDIVRPLVSCDGLSKFTDGKIIQQPEWGIVYSATVKGKLIKRLFRIDDKGKFSNSHILAILKRMVAFDDNSVKELSEVSDHLNWTMGVRRVMLEAIPLIFNP